MEQAITLDEVKEKLKAGGFTGLYNNDGPCGCHIDDLAPCGECNVEIVDCGADGLESEDWINGCDAGHKHIDQRSKLGDWVISASKGPPTPDEFDHAFAQC